MYSIQGCFARGTTNSVIICFLLGGRGYSRSVFDPVEATLRAFEFRKVHATLGLPWKTLKPRVGWMQGKASMSSLVLSSCRFHILNIKKNIVYLVHTTNKSILDRALGLSRTKVTKPKYDNLTFLYDVSGSAAQSVRTRTMPIEKKTSLVCVALEAPVLLLMFRAQPQVFELNCCGPR